MNMNDKIDLLCVDDGGLIWKIQNASDHELVCVQVLKKPVTISAFAFACHSQLIVDACNMSTVRSIRMRLLTQLYDDNVDILRYMFWKAVRKVSGTCWSAPS